MNNRSSKLLIGAVALVCLLAFQVSAKADTITYDFTGTGWLSGTNFTYELSGDFLSFPSGNLAPTTPGDLVIFGIDRGPVTSFDFLSLSSYTISSSSGSFSVSGGMNYSLSTLGTQVLRFGILTITDPPAALPEPSTFFLMAVGLAATLLFSQRKCPFPQGVGR